VETALSWLRPTSNPRLAADAVDVWRAGLDLPTPEVWSHWCSLSADEQARAQRYHFARDRRRFIVARGTLRRLLANYLGVSARALRFCAGPFGKPALAGQYAANGLAFNLSHSQGLALYAVAYFREVGVDVEHFRADLAEMDLAERFFALRESLALRALPAERGRAAFYRCWTQKEAYLKARGDVPRISLNQFRVTTNPDQPAALLDFDGDAEEPARWTLIDLAPGPDLVGVLAVAGRPVRISCWEYEGSSSGEEHLRKEAFHHRLERRSEPDAA
jgi:4'-phosphopantetheinyl transferase